MRMRQRVCEGRSSRSSGRGLSSSRRGRSLSLVGEEASLFRLEHRRSYLQVRSACSSGRAALCLCFFGGRLEGRRDGKGRRDAKGARANEREGRPWCDVRLCWAGLEDLLGRSEVVSRPSRGVRQNASHGPTLECVPSPSRCLAPAFPLNFSQSVLLYRPRSHSHWPPFLVSFSPASSPIVSAARCDAASGKSDLGCLDRVRLLLWRSTCSGSDAKADSPIAICRHVYGASGVGFKGAFLIPEGDACVIHPVASLAVVEELHPRKQRHFQSGLQSCVLLHTVMAALPWSPALVLAPEVHEHVVCFPCVWLGLLRGHVESIRLHWCLVHFHVLIYRLPAQLACRSDGIAS